MPPLRTTACSARSPLTHKTTPPGSASTSAGHEARLGDVDDMFCRLGDGRRQRHVGRQHAIHHVDCPGAVGLVAAAHHVDAGRCRQLAVKLIGAVGAGDLRVGLTAWLALALAPTLCSIAVTPAVAARAATVAPASGWPVARSVTTPGAPVARVKP